MGLLGGPRGTYRPNSCSALYVKKKNPPECQRPSCGQSNEKGLIPIDFRIIRIGIARACRNRLSARGLNLARTIVGGSRADTRPSISREEVG